MRARVEYRGGMSYTVGGRTYTKGQPVEITDAALVRKLQGISGFKVSILAAPAPAKTEVVTEPDQGDEDDDGDGGEEEANAEPAEPAQSAPKAAKAKSAAKRPAKVKFD